MLGLNGSLEQALGQLRERGDLFATEIEEGVLLGIPLAGSSSDASLVFYGSVHGILADDREIDAQPCGLVKSRDRVPIGNQFVEECRHCFANRLDGSSITPT